MRRDCPFRYDNYGKHIQCIGYDCAIYDQSERECSILSLSSNMKQIKEMMKQKN